MNANRRFAFGSEFLSTPRHGWVQREFAVVHSALLLSDLALYAAAEGVRTAAAAERWRDACGWSAHAAVALMSRC